MQIINSTPNDTQAILDLYEAAIAYQKTKFYRHWLGFDRQLIEKEINENRQFKIVVDNTIACIFVVSFSDAPIWGARDKDPFLYIHRAVTNPEFRGNHYVRNIVEWAIQYCNITGRKFVRMDTWSDNEKLIEYYTNYGFTFIGLTDVLSGESLPAHYEGIRLSLFELAVKDHTGPLKLNS